MTTEYFDRVVEEQIAYCEELLLSKGQEYAPDRDRLAAFKKAAALEGTTTKAALFGMLSKHLVSIADMCMINTPGLLAKWTEKITDSINYLLLLKAVIMEELDNGETRN